MTAEKINEAVEKIHKGVDQLFEIREMLVDINVDVELLTIVDDVIEQFIDTSTWLSDNWFSFTHSRRHVPLEWFNLLFFYKVLIMFLLENHFNIFFNPNK